MRDTGSGIAPEDLPHVFERFQKGSGSRGSGLGIARKLALARRRHRYGERAGQGH